MWDSDKKALVENTQELLTSPETVAEAMLELCENPEYGNGTILEIMKDHERIVPLYNADPPPASKVDVNAIHFVYNQLLERLGTEGLNV